MGSQVIQAAVVIVSDTRASESDLSGNRLVELLSSSGADVIVRRLVTDDHPQIRDLISMLADREDINLVITTGGTGLGPRDNTPEATLAVIEREAPGIAEAFRRETAAKTPMAMLARGVCGVRNRTLIINLPGSPRAVEECFEVIRPVLDHAIRQVIGDTKHEE